MPLAMQVATVSVFMSIKYSILKKNRPKGQRIDSYTRTRRTVRLSWGPYRTITDNTNYKAADYLGHIFLFYLIYKMLTLVN